MLVRRTPNEFHWAIKANGLWKMVVPSFVSIQTEDEPGLLIYKFRAGYITDFRSGSSLINPLIPQVGEQAIALAWLIHDANYHGFLSRARADRLLQDMLVNAGMSKFKAWLVYTSVRAFGGDHYNELVDDQGAIYNANRDRYLSFEWRPR